ncbi:MAG TPA: HAD hydrolase family protein [Phycisphaerae bacterium]|nr:HAD hydrolase family protein [Phycisphaerae bacterium]
MNTPDLSARLQRLSVVITDVDGVLTDGGMYYGEGGDEFKKFNIRDGAGVALLKAAGLVVGALTGESRRLNARRLEKIGVDFYFEGVRDKRQCLHEYLTQSGIEARQVAFIGDEINDYCLLGEVGVFFAVADACSEIRERADQVLRSRGGEGALREAATIILEAQGKAGEALQTYLQANASDRHPRH